MLSLIWRAVSRSLALKFLKGKVLNARHQALRAFLYEDKKIVLPIATHPKCTVIIPTYNGAEHTLQCLLSLVPQCAEWMEILVHDDCSTDETMKLLSRFGNLSIVRSSGNIGFLKSINSAVNHARGEFVILMNNDARLAEGSIQQMIAQFENDPSCGYMGARVMLADGTLQEAGCMIFQNGQTSGYLRFSRNDDLRALYMREVDYCSAVFCLIKREQFQKMGGFDMAYAPAYFEETDFCMRLRQAGLHCLYNPAILIEHFEFGSLPSSSARKAISDRRRVFLDRWRNTLSEERFPKSLFGSNPELAARRLQQRPRQLLVVSGPDVADILIDEAIEESGSTTVHFVGFTEREVKLKVGRFGPDVEVTCSKYPSGVEKLLKGRRNFFDTVKRI